MKLECVQLLMEIYSDYNAHGLTEVTRRSHRDRISGFLVRVCRIFAQ